MAQFLGYPYATPVTVNSNQPHFTTDTLNLSRTSAVSTAQRWEMQVQLGPDSTGRLQADLQAHRTVNGFHTAFDIPIYQHHGLVASAAQPITVQATANLNSDTVMVLSQNTFTIPAGYYIRFSNHSKVYLVTQTLEGVANVAQTLNIFPRLRSALTTSDTVDITDINLRAKYDVVDLIGYTYTRGIVTRATVSVVEDV